MNGFEQRMRKQTDRERPDASPPRTSMSESSTDSPSLLEDLEAENAALRNSVVMLALEIRDLRQRR
jgi:hypothetical protein